MSRFLLFILFFPLLLSAQDKTIDSLKLALKNAKHDTIRCNILSTLAETASDEEWPVYNDQLLKLAEKCLATTAHSPFYLKHLSNSYNNIGYLAIQHGDMSKALEYFNKSLKISTSINYKSGIIGSFANIGSVYNNLGDVQKALDYSHKSLKLQEEINDKKGISSSLSNIGSIYESQGEIKKALEYFLESLKIREEIKDEYGISLSFNNIGDIYFIQNNNQKALEYLQKSLKIQEEIQYKHGIGYSLHNIGSVYYNQGDFEKAIEYYNKSLKIKEELEDKEGIASSLNDIASCMLRKGLIDNALNYASRSYKLAKELNYPLPIYKVAGTLVVIYKKQNKYKESLEMYELEIQMRDSISNTETKKASIKKQFQYEYEKKATADSVKHAEEQKVKNALLTAQNAQLKQEKTQRIALYGGLVIVISFLGFVFNRFRVTQKQKVIIEEQKVLVDNAFAHLEEKNKEVLDSIRYAKRIQTALLTSEKYIERKLNDLN